MSDPNLTDPPIHQTDSPDRSEAVPTAVPEKLEKIIEGVPEPQQHVFREMVREFMGVFHSKTSSPFDIDPQIVKILAESQTKDNDNKFEFAKQRQQDTHEMKKIEHLDRQRLIRPAVYVVLGVFPVLLFVGIYLAATGQAALGTGLITGVVTSFLAYVAGTSDIFKSKP